MSSLFTFITPLAVVGAAGLIALLAPVPTPPTPDELAEVAIMAMKLNDPRAAGLYADVLARDPSNKRGNFGAAMLAYDAGDFKEAEARLKALIAADPDHFEGRLTLAAVYTKLKKYDEAAAILQQLAPLEPSDSRIFFNLTYVEIERNHFEAALGHATTYLSLVPEGGPGRPRMVALEKSLREVIRKKKTGELLPPPWKK